ncbi:MAG: MFS transporter [Chloroflexota bacterium]
METAVLELPGSPVASGGPVVARPTRPLPLGQLLNLSFYWLGLTAIWAGLDATVLPKRMEQMLGTRDAPLGLAIVVAAGVLMPILVQPTMGMISDHTTSRWGRRKPYIAIGAVLDVLLLLALASSNTFLALTICYVLLQLSSNLAQGPFQGYMPDLVPEAQVGRASGLMGLMVVLGQVGGTFVASLGLGAMANGEPASVAMFWPTVGLGLIELLTAAVLLLRVDPGPTGLPREGRSWRRIAGAAWGRDVLHHRSFVWLVASRLCFLAATGSVIRFALFFLTRSLGQSDAEAQSTINLALLAVVLPAAITVLPAARVSDRIGRKRVIWIACAIGGACMTGVALAPSVAVGVLCLVPVGVAVGSFLSVDWALMTDIIPKASAGRYMGLSNMGTAMAGPVAAVAGGVAMWLVGGLDPAWGPRAAFLVATGFFVLCALLLRPVDPTPRD